MLITAGLAQTFGATATWNGGDGNWGSGSNWSPSGVPGAADDAVFDGLTNGTGGVVDLNPGGGTREINSILFLAGIGSYTLDARGNGAKRLDIGSGGIVNSSSSEQIFTSEVLLTAPQTWDAAFGDITADNVVNLQNYTLEITGSKTTTFNGVLEGTGGLTKSGTGTLALNADNTYTGTTTIKGGKLRYGSPQTSLGALVLEGGALDANGHDLTYTTLTLDSAGNGGAGLDMGVGLAQTISFDSVNYISGTLDIMHFDSATTSLLVQNDPGASFLSNLLFDGVASGGSWNPVTKEILGLPEPRVSVLTMAIMALGCVRRRGKHQSPRTA